MSAITEPVAPSLDSVEARIASLSLRQYVPMAWPLLEPHPYSSNWHIDVMCEYLEAISAGEVRRLIINIPPRHMKSLLVAVFWPTWDWLTNPWRRWMFASYAEDLSKRDSLKSRRLIESMPNPEGKTLLERLGYYGLLMELGNPWSLSSDQNEKLKFENTASGYRIATSVGGRSTGEGGHIVGVDDPHKADEVHSDAKRNAVLDWFDGSMTTRWSGDPAKKATLIVMQRLHEEDLTGHLLGKGDWEHLCLPAEYEPTHPFVWPDDPREDPGQLLWPSLVTEAVLTEIKSDLGSAYSIAGQLQQRPSPAEGGILKRYWWKFYPPEWLDDEEWHGPTFQRIWQSWDTALKEKTDTDFTVGQLWGQDLADKFLLRQVRGRWGLNETKTQMRELTAWADRRWPRLLGHQKRIENTANGPEIIAALRKEIGGLVPVTVDKDKVSRAYAITPQLEGGNVHLPGFLNAEGTSYDPATPEWVQEYVEEHSAFPNAANDDQVDATTQALDPTFSGGKPRRPRGGGRDKRAMAMRR